MEEEEVNESWMEELEIALRDEQLLHQQNSNETNHIDEATASPSTKQQIAESIRPELWKKLLDVYGKEDKNVVFQDIYDLPEQNQLRNDCKSVVVKLGNDDEDKVSVLSDLESILTHFCKSDKTHSRHYEKDNGWIELLVPILALKLPKHETYNLFESIYNKYVARHEDIYHTLSLLILYHDPHLSNFLITKKITSTYLFTKSWFQTLFAAQCNLPVIHEIWDQYFQEEDPFFIFFLALVMIVNAREEILALKDEPRDKIIEALIMLPCGLKAEDVLDFCSLAQYYYCKTPCSFKMEFEKTSFFDSTVPDKTFISQALCLPVSAKELLNYSRNVIDYEEGSLRFFIIDCRPAPQYNSGHLSTAFHLDSNLMLQAPKAFETAVEALLSCQRDAIKQGRLAVGEHICFLGCGQLEDDQFTHMVVSYFLQKQYPYISLVKGGYQSVHQFLDQENSLNDCLVDHNPSECLICRSSSPSKKTPSNRTSPSMTSSKSSSDLFGKIGAAMKMKSAEVKEKIFEIMSTPSTSTPSSSSNDSKYTRVNKSNKYNRPSYQSSGAVFSIDDDHEPDDLDNRLNDDDNEDYIDTISSWLKRKDVVASFECQQITMNGFVFDSVLLITETHLIVLRELKNRQGSVEMVVHRSLATIGKITSKKKNPEFITLQYGTPNSSGPSDVDRFLIPQAKEATTILSKLIMERSQALNDISNREIKENSHD